MPRPAWVFDSCAVTDPQQVPAAGLTLWSLRDGAIQRWMNSLKTFQATTRNLLTGGAGFVGSHVVDRLMEAGEEVICFDNYFTGRKVNIEQWIGHPRFELIRHDVTEPIKLEMDRIWHLA